MDYYPLNVMMYEATPKYCVNAFEADTLGEIVDNELIKGRTFDGQQPLLYAVKYSTRDNPFIEVVPTSSNPSPVEYEVNTRHEKTWPMVDIPSKGYVFSFWKYPDSEKEEEFLGSIIDSYPA